MNENAPEEVVAPAKRHDLRVPPPLFQMLTQSEQQAYGLLDIPPKLKYFRQIVSATPSENWWT